jgi:hypothetical protein
MQKKHYFFILLFLYYSSLFCQENYESQKYTYETKTLNIQVTANKYSVKETDTIDLSIKFLNNSPDTSFINLFDKIQNIHKNNLTMAIFFSRFNEPGEEYLDTLLVLNPKSELSFDFKIPVNDYYGFKNKFGIIETFLELGYFSSIDQIKNPRYTEKEVFFEKNLLILPHSIIEFHAQKLQIRMFSFLLN